MNIKLLDSWVKDYLKTKASAKTIAEKLSLTSVSIERVEPFGKDFVYDIEITTNRPDLASAVSIAREAAAVLPEFGIPATFQNPKLTKPTPLKNPVPLTIKNDKTLVHRVCAVVMDVVVGKSPELIKTRLETAGIRSLNNVIDVTNYVMRTIGHPMHVFDYDRIKDHIILIRESKKGEQIVTLDKKDYELPGGDIVAEDTDGDIIDLLGIMGLENSVVTSETKRIIFFIDNVDPLRIRKTSMTLGIRTEAAQLNEKGIDPTLSMDALLLGIQLLQDHANGTVVSNIIDIYPNKPKEKNITVPERLIQSVMGVPISLKKSAEILKNLGFNVTINKETLSVIIPTSRTHDMDIPEDVVEEIARIYGYHNIPSILPQLPTASPYHKNQDQFYFENRVKEAMMYWGFTETYTYSFVSEDLYEGPLTDAITLANPLTEDMVYMRRTLIPSILQVLKENKAHDTLSLFEIANVYEKNGTNLPIETRMIAGIMRKPKASFYEMKGVVEQLLHDVGISDIRFLRRTEGLGADIKIEKENVGYIEVLDEHIVNFELNFEIILQYATLKKIYKPIAKFPPIIEDISLILPEETTTADVIEEIGKQSNLIAGVTLLDTYENTRTFHILYQHSERNLTGEEVGKIREHLIKTLKSKFKAEVK